MAQVFKTAPVKAAKIAGLDPEMDAAAARFEAVLQAEIAKFSKTGDFARSIKTRSISGKKGVRDRLVYSTDPGALSIEFGHMEGDTHVKGNFAFHNAARKFKKYYGK